MPFFPVDPYFDDGEPEHFRAYLLRILEPEFPEHTKVPPNPVDESFSALLVVPPIPELDDIDADRVRIVMGARAYRNYRAYNLDGGLITLILLNSVNLHRYYLQVPKNIVQEDRGEFGLDADGVLIFTPALELPGGAHLDEPNLRVEVVPNECIVP